MRLRRILCTSLLLAAVSTIAAEESLAPIGRQIDRPLHDPIGVIAARMRVSGESRHGADSLMLRYSFSGLSYTVTDRISFPLLPYPVLQVLVRKPRADARPGSLSSLSLAVRAGTTASFSPSHLVGVYQFGNSLDEDHIRLMPRITLLGKLPVSRWFWVDGELAAGLILREAVQGLFAPRAGFQVTRWAYATIGYRYETLGFREYRPNDVRSYLYRYATTLDFYSASTETKPGRFDAHSMPISLGFSLKQWSFELSTSLDKSTGVTLPVSLNIAFALRQTPGGKTNE